MSERPSYRSEYVHWAADAWLLQTIREWRESGIPSHTPWFWRRDVAEVARERGLITEEESHIIWT